MLCSRIKLPSYALPRNLCPGFFACKRVAAVCLWPHWPGACCVGQLSCPHDRNVLYSSASFYFKILTKDSVTISVDAVVYYRVQDATMSIANVENADGATRLLAQTTLRNMLGTKSLSEVLTDREHISSGMQVGGSVVAIIKHVYPLLR